VLEAGCSSGDLLAMLNGRDKHGIDVSEKQVQRARSEYPHLTFESGIAETYSSPRRFDYVVACDTLNLASDSQLLLENMHRLTGDESRLIVSIYNTLWSPLLALAALLGLRQPPPQSSWLSRMDVQNLLDLSGWETVKCKKCILLPIEIPLLTGLINRWIAPLLPFLCLSIVFVARKRAPAKKPMSVSVVVPARNEAGNIQAAVQRTPAMGSWTELIFVEGGSSDETWEEIQKLQQLYPDRRIKTLRQTGKGKGNAVRDGYAVAEGEILMILDADLTVPPEDLPKFYDAITSGLCDFANGCRLVYPMESGAMQFANLCANKAFGLTFSWLLEQPLKDTLCGTKVLTRANYDRLASNRAYFGDFDPFGDFDLLFGADKLNLKIRDIPIRYKERTYGSTNIQRWKHGVLLLRMVLFAARKLRFV
jgi:SAM-dependent methyltransferase